MEERKNHTSAAVSQPRSSVTDGEHYIIYHTRAMLKTNYFKLDRNEKLIFTLPSHRYKQNNIRTESISRRGINTRFRFNTD